MFRTQIIEFLEAELTPHQYEYKEEPPAFGLRPDRPMPWLQSILLWGLEKLGAFHIGTQYAFTRHVVDIPDLADKIQQQDENIWDLYERRGERILIGPEEFSAWTRNPPPKGMVSFRGSITRGGRIEYLNMTVTIVPWMKGVLVLPRLSDGEVY